MSRQDIREVFFTKYPNLILSNFPEEFSFLDLKKESFPQM